MDTETQLMSQQGKSIPRWLGIGPIVFIVRWLPKTKGDSEVGYFLHGDWKTDVGEIRAIASFSTLQPASTKLRLFRHSEIKVGSLFPLAGLVLSTRSSLLDKQRDPLFLVGETKNPPFEQ